MKAPVSRLVRWRAEFRAVHGGVSMNDMVDGQFGRVGVVEPPPDPEEVVDVLLLQRLAGGRCRRGRRGGERRGWWSGRWWPSQSRWVVGILASSSGVVSRHPVGLEGGVSAIVQPPGHPDRIAFANGFKHHLVMVAPRGRRIRWLASSPHKAVDNGSSIRPTVDIVAEHDH